MRKCVGCFINIHTANHDHGRERNIWGWVAEVKCSRLMLCFIYRRSWKSGVGAWYDPGWLHSRATTGKTRIQHCGVCSVGRLTFVCGTLCRILCLRTLCNPNTQKHKHYVRFYSFCYTEQSYCELVKFDRLSVSQIWLVWIRVRC